MLKEVWSGGQYGADIAGLRAAVAVGLKTGGFMPKGWRTISGPRPEYAELYGLRETASTEYPERTRLNVKGTDATLFLGDRSDSRGCVLTRRICDKNDKYFLTCDSGMTAGTNEGHYSGMVAKLLQDWNVERLNIAGNRDADEQIVEAWLRRVFVAAKEKGAA